MPVGETRESDHINCTHWNYNILLTAWREGALWRIHRSDTGQTLFGMANLEVAWWNEADNFIKELKVSWDGDDFRLMLSNDAFFRNSHVLNYQGNDPRGEIWQCHWDPKKRLFVHRRLK